MADNIVKGFQTDNGLGYYDYNSLANKPTLITQTQIDAAVQAANKYTDSEIAKLDLSGGNVQIELDTTLSVSGKAADAYSVGQALNGKLGASELQTAVNDALAQAKDTGEFDGKDGEDGYTPQKGVDYFDGEDGKDYVLTDADKNEIAQLAADLIEIPESGGGGTVDLTGYATQDWVSKNYQIKGDYLTSVPAGYAKTEDIPTDAHINSLIDAKFAQFTNVAEVGA